MGEVENGKGKSQSFMTIHPRFRRPPASSFSIRPLNVIALKRVTQRFDTLMTFKSAVIYCNLDGDSLDIGCAYVLIMPNLYDSNKECCGLGCVLAF